MLGFFIILMTAILVIDCVILVLLVLMQLPKKEAGAGLAFGGAATDALFGAGSGNFLTKATKYAAGVFFALAILLSVLETQRFHRGTSAFQRGVEQQSKQPVTTPTIRSNSAARTPSAPAVPGTNQSVPILLPVNTNSPPK